VKFTNFWARTAGLIKGFRHLFHLSLGKTTAQMKQFSLILNGVLLVAVGYLYYLQFSAGSDDASDLPVISKSVAVSPGGIYFLNSDSLLDNYEYYKAKKVALEKKQERIRMELKAAGQKLEADVENYQRNAPGMTDAQRQQTEESLMQRQQQLVDQKDRLLTQLDEEQAQYSDSLFYRLTAFLKAYNKDKSIHYVLGYQRGGGILYANDSLDITEGVLKGLNKAWEKEQGK